MSSDRPLVELAARLLSQLPPDANENRVTWTLAGVLEFVRLEAIERCTLRGGPRSERARHALSWTISRRVACREAGHWVSLENGCVIVELRAGGYGQSEDATALVRMVLREVLSCESERRRIESEEQGQSCE